MKLKTPLMGLLLLGLTVPVIAADKSKAAMDKHMQDMMKYGTPGEAHKALNPIIGVWDVVVRGWMEPGAKAEESKGVSDHTWIFGGRFVEQNFRGAWAGQPFEGLGYTGYDNLRQEYQSIWMDSMSTAMMINDGTYNAGTKTLTSEGNFSCPMTGEKEKWFRSELKIIDNDKHTYSSYQKDAKGKEFKAMEIVYTRKK